MPKITKQDIYDILEDYKLDYEPPDYNFYSKNRLRDISNIRWAVDELEHYIFRNWGKEAPIDACNSFIVDMNYFMHKYPKTQKEFFTAISVAEDIRDVFICSFTKGEHL